MVSRDPVMQSGEWKRMQKRWRAKRMTYCWLCQGTRGPIRYDVKYPHPLGFSLDHVMPRSWYAHLSPEAYRAAILDETNVRPAHLTCNVARKDDAPPAHTLRPNPGKVWGST